MQDPDPDPDPDPGSALEKMDPDPGQFFKICWIFLIKNIFQIFCFIFFAFLS